ncbi:MAG: sdhA [Gammaproteobacteria bacterium]|jgi:succinate dehydrogenase / fumarate reductase flavoprotein subunit|nr:sdhA [Gammaproteobacteria bacterium]
MNISHYEFDAIVIGAGGAGMRTSLQLANAGLNVALVSKVFPTRSHTVCAQGGITVALGNMHEDDWRWHMYDTVKGSDYIGDQDCIEYLCQNAPDAVYELERMGLPFSRIDNGKIYQRPFGGQSRNFGGEQAARTAAAADRTGHALLHTLYQQNVKAKANFFTEWYALDLVKAADGSVVGALVMCIETGEIAYMHSRATILATGGAGRIYQSTTNAFINTGDGIGMAMRAGFPVQDMEMWQFHPTGVAGAGVLITEGVRGEGGYLINKDGERFMERYAPHAKDLASRDVVARAMAVEIREGRHGMANGVPCVYLKLDHLGEEVISQRLPGIREIAKTFAHVDPVNAPVPVVPTCHYMMGGIPTNKHGQALNRVNGQDKIIPGLYAVGECACVSVHGANRLGGNSLTDLIVFGRGVGIHVENELKQNHLHFQAADDASMAQGLQRLNRWNTHKDGEDFMQIRDELRAVMQNDFGVFRTGQYMAEGLKKLEVLHERLKHASMKDFSQVFNTTRVEALEMDNLMAVARATALSAVTRTESRGAHSREDYPKRDDANWIKHTLYVDDDKIGQIDYREVNMQPLTVPAFQPKERVY